MMHSAQRWLKWLVAAGIVFIGACTEPAGDNGLVLSGRTMGTTYTVRGTNCGSVDCADIELAMKERLTQLTLRLSHYESSSELSRFNEYDGTDWFAVSEDLARVVDYAQSVSRLSEGAFDISVGPAVDAWGFGPSVTAGVPPAAESLRELQQHSGYRKLEARTTPPALRKTDPLLRLDLSAIAKGYAVDQLAYLLESSGVRNYLVEIGGELRTAGVRADGKPWRIGIQQPGGDAEIEFVVLPGDSAVATSGDYQNFYIVDERRISHTIDPATGAPVEQGLASAPVIAPDAMQADALATALMVLGPERAAGFADRHGIAMLLLVRDGDDIRPVMSAAFRPYLLTK
jgi:thiamine biosynthesis lipoprotein